MRAVLPLALLLALGLAACGGSSSSSGGGGGGSSESAASKSPCPSGAVVVHMHNIQFAPQTVGAKVGGKVCWRNGETFTTTVAKAGDISYVCTVHPNMTATIKVKP